MGPADARGYFQLRNTSRVGNGNTESGRKRKLSQIAFIIAMLVLSVAPACPRKTRRK